MKHKGNKSDINLYRDRDLQLTFRRAYCENPRMTFKQLVAIIIASPAQRFWVSDERAIAVVSQIERGISLDGMSPERIAMYREIYSRCLHLRSLHPSFTMPRIVNIVVHQPAPRFYLTPGSARVILYQIFKRCREQRKSQSL